MNYKVGVIKRVAFLLMTMALAVAMVACEGAVGKPGLPGKPADPALQPPYVALALPDLPALVQGMSDTVDLSTAFGDPDGETLTLSAKSTDPAIATAKVSGKTLTVTGVKVGTTSVVVTATDADDLKVSQSVQVTVTAAPPEPDPPVTIDDVKTKYPTLVITPTTAADVSMEIELPAEHTLESENQSVVTVARKMAAAPASSIRWAAATADTTANVWVVTAVAKGLTNVDVLDKSGASVHTIRVRVATNPPAPEPDPVAPTKVKPIEPQMIYLADGSETIDLSEHFSHDNEITYESDVRGDAVNATIAGSMLTLDPVIPGSARVTVTATADGKSSRYAFRVTVEDGSKPTLPVTPPVPTVAPTLTAEIGDMMLYLLDDAESIELSEHFAHADEITYMATVRGSAVDAEVSGSTLTVTPVLTGDSRVTVTATVGDKSIADSFMVNVKPGSTPVIPKVAPTKVKPIIGPMIYQGDGPETINLSEHFSHENEIMYEAAVRGAAVDAEIAGSILTLDPVLPGSARVTVTATADGKSSSYAFTVTVKAGTKPPPPPPEAIDKKGTINDVTVEVDETKTVNVADNFTFTEGVSYGVDKDKSNDEATATVDASGMVSITGKMVGEMTLTVIATDARDNEAMQTIAVTVTPAGAQYKPRTLTIGGVGMVEEVRLDEGQSLESRDKSKVTVAEKSGMGNLWTITAVKKGTVEVRIWNENQTIDQLIKVIKVTVENTDPKKMDTLPSMVVAVSDGTDAGDGRHVTIDDKDVYKETAADMPAPTVSGAKDRLYHLVAVDFAKYFEDKDGFPGDIPKNGYKADSNDPDVKIVGTPTAMGVPIDVTRDTDSGFPLVIYVMDKDGGKSEEVTITVGAPDAIIADLYEVTQVADKAGGFSKATVGLRKDIAHTLTFADYDPANNHQGLRFANLFTAKLTAEAEDDAVILSTVTGPRFVAPTGDKADAADKSAPYYTVGVGTNDPIELVPTKEDTDKGLTFVGGVPTLMFEVTGSEDATVTITYHVSVGRNKNADGKFEYEWETTSKKLKMNIVSSL